MVTSSPAYPQRGLAELFEDEACRRPEALAVIFGQEQVCYGELNRRANRLAHFLRRNHAVAPDVPVGVCLERSVELIVSLLGILKAGGAYVALDPEYPRARLTQMLANADVPVLLTQSSLLDRMPTFAGESVCWENLRAALEIESEENPASEVGLDHLSYISYTSGSTGVPKGVAVTQRGVVRLVKAGGFARLDEHEVFLQLAPVGFDASTLEIWGSLLNGGQLVVMPPGAPSLVALGQVLREHRVTTLWLTAGLFHFMVDERLDDLRGVRQLLAGGDVLSVPHVRRAAAGLPDCQLINGYGPTENTTFTCCYAIPRKIVDDTTSVPIGSPIGHTTVYILNETGEPVPPGATGELFIGGDGLARGYWREPELTAEKFVPDAFSAQPGARLYRSGDLVRQWPDGNLEFLGRTDAQVKIRGHRVELTEIESVLSQHPTVRQVAVAVTRNASDAALVAGCVLHGAFPTTTPGELRTWLKDRLPEQMLPARLAFLPQLPLTANGKVDRAAVAALVTSAQIAPAFSVAPITSSEKLVAGVWKTLLPPGQPLGIDDNFFEIGGHSLLAVKAHADLCQRLERDFPIAEFFQHPTIRALAAHLSAPATAMASAQLFSAAQDRARRQREAAIRYRPQRVSF